ncbi:RING domain-containing protein [Cryptosporidium ubiquitum]|uniref:RING domain-containing protein n=1 Tax=Cryptosporidium ubiquitum TaxID=857276 RepID=A0A1J4MR59_9CRYT|nr:RING domain-containing protein [Cryptosporidium ubiquitum]OII75484.1 RING domain-containing protein [Cryptosporidium ubiquitum]
MSVTLGSILFPERRKVVVDTRKGLHNKRKKQVNAQKSQEQTSKQFTTRLLLDDETIAPNDFLTPFPTDDVRNTEQFWEYLERVFYPVDERWISILDLSARPQNMEPKEACIGLHFAYRWALVDLFDTSELFKLVGNRNKIFKNIIEKSKNSSSENKISSKHVEQDQVLDKSEKSQLDGSENSDLEEQKIISYLEFLDLPILELIGIDPTILGGINTNGGNSTKQSENSSQNKRTVNNPYFEEWKFLYKRLCYIEKEVDSMLLKLTNNVSENIHKDNSRKLLQRHQKKKCREFLLKVMHYHSMRQFVDSLEEVLYFDEKTGLYLTTWDDGEAVRAAWVSQDQLLQLLLFRPSSTESKYSVSIPSEYIPYARSLDTNWLRYLLDSGLTMINDNPDNSQDDDRLGDTLNLDSPSKPKDGCIELSRHPLCHYCRRSCKRLNYSRCPSKIKPLNLGINPSGLNQTNQSQNLDSNSILNNSNSLKLPGASTSTSSSNIYYSRSLIPWRVPKSQKNMENSDHSEPTYIINNNQNHSQHINQTQFGCKSGRSINLNGRPSVGGNSCGPMASYLLNVNRSHVCNICTDFESNLDKSEFISQEEILISRAYSPNNCWRMYCSECIMHNFSSVIKQKYSSGIVLRYYCPFCNGACNCERCLRNQQIRKIKNYLKSRFCGYVFQCSISSCVIQNELSWYDFLKDFGGDSLLFPHVNNTFKENTMTGNSETTLINDQGEIDESLVNLKNIAIVSYINNANRRFSIAENTHLGFIWLQANNIQFQKPPPSSSTGNTGSRDHNSKKTTILSGSSSGNNISDHTKLLSKNKSRNRSSINGTQKNKRCSSIQSNFEDTDLGNTNGTKLQQNTQTVSSNSIFSSNIHKSHSNSIKGNGAHNSPPSIHIPREVVNEPTHASGASVLWSLRSILINNVNKYHKECLSNLERWEVIQELYNRKRVELECYFEELLSKLNLMDEWIRSISFTETNKRFIMRKMPLLCWATDIPSAKTFNYDDYPQLMPNNNVVEMIKHIQNFVKNGIVSEDLPTHQILGFSEVDEGGGITGISQKTTPSLKLIDKLPGMMTTNSPSSVMEFLMNSISEIQNIVVKTNNNSSKDDSGKTNKIQRNSKRDKSNSKNPTQNKLPSCDILNPDEVKVSSFVNGLASSSSSSSSTAEAEGNQVNSNSPINAEFLSNKNSELEIISSNDKSDPSQIFGPSNGGAIQKSDKSDLPNFNYHEGHNSSINPFIYGNNSYMLDEGTIDTFQPYSNKTIPNQDPSVVDSIQNKSKKRRSSLELTFVEIMTPERKRELALKRRRDRETIRKAMKINNHSSSSSTASSNIIGGTGIKSVEDISSLSGDGTVFSISSNGSSFGSPQL